ncbi:MAG: hypothetical protein PHP74_03020, partial [Candidatus Gracilibacteria bacterium]|nr:hypothetical protein [Candidatus Gracilibacteria bacterium]
MKKKLLLLVLPALALLIIAYFLFLMPEKEVEIEVPETNVQDSETLMMESLGFNNCEEACDHYVDKCLSLVP